MLRTSTSVDAMGAGPDRTLALDHLHQGQSNDCYWHGVFGGIYISHMRLATLEHLIAAEDLADRSARLAGRPVDGIRAVDTDLDGTDELLASSPGQVVVIDPGEGGGIGSWDIRAARHALTAVMRRRPEAYHARLIAHEATDAAGAAGHGSGSEAPTIHDVVRSREPGLAARLRYDAYERRSGLVHLFAPGTTAEVFADGAAVELGDARDGRYEVVRMDGAEVVLGRDVELATTAGPAALRVEKRFLLDGDRAEPALDLEVTVENRSSVRVAFDLAIEHALTMLGGGGNPAAFYRFGDEELRHDTSGTRHDIDRIVSGNSYIGLELVTTLEPAATVWWSPIETISNSEYGFERVYQGSALVASWPTELAPGARRTVAVRGRVRTTIDRLAGELAG
jgi:alpha-amylase